jgi:pSer/pThr/pTyr-binding forkhead associated (FHA) protein
LKAQYFLIKTPSTMIQVKQNEAAAWDDLDWGAMEAEPVVLLEAEAPSFATSEAEQRPVEMKAEIPAAPPVARLKESPPLEPAAACQELRSTSLLPMTAETVARLILTLADGSTQEVMVRGELFTVGRKSDNHLAIKDRHVSGAHARLVLRTDGAYDLEDLGSSGGTLVNDFQMDAPKRLASGDMIEFATVRAQFEYLSGPPVEDDMEFGSTLPHTRNKAAPAQVAAPVLLQPRLVIAMPDGSSSVLELRGKMNIGRIEGNDIVIPQDNVSSRHAQLICHSGGIVELIDLGSTCGTFVNGKLIEQKSLAGGDHLRFGAVEAVFETPDSLAKVAAVALPVTAKETVMPLPKLPQAWK